ncbi:MAG: membrane protein insertase YidC [Bdellovibrionales bacterium]
MKQENENFLDSRTLLAVLLVGATFIGWQMYMQRKYPDTLNKNAPITATDGKATTAKKGTESKGAALNGAATAPEGKIYAAPVVAEKVEHFTSENLAFDISSRGMGLKKIEILKYKTRPSAEHPATTVTIETPDEGNLPFETRLTGQAAPVNFHVEKVNPNLYVGHASSGGVQITKTIEIDADKYVLNIKVAATGSDPKFTGLTTALIEDVLPEVEREGFLAKLFSDTRILNPRRQKQEFFIDTAEGKDRVLFGKEDVKKSWSKVKIASIGSQYFTQTILDKSQIMPEASAILAHAEKSGEVLLNYPVLNPGAGVELAYVGFVGPKSLTILKEVDDSLAKVVDYGYFTWIGRHILDLLRFFYGLVGNWGVAIILLTLCVRLIVLPVNIYSFKSMRAMQAIQPQLKELRERYKDDQQKQQQEVMALMKVNKVNPVSGCLPVFLQFPIFIALYQVLGNSIELYQAPFGLWLHDLSLKDPFYILPVLMGLTMFVQQKLTPNTMDPAQAKVMLMMPLVFSIFLASTPSGLTLYMWVGALFSVVQQGYFMKQPKTLSSGSKA